MVSHRQPVTKQRLVFVYTDKWRTLHSHSFLYQCKETRTVFNIMRARFTQQPASPDSANHIVTLKSPVYQWDHLGQTKEMGGGEGTGVWLNI